MTDIKEQIKKAEAAFGESWAAFVAKAKELNIEAGDWNFSVGKSGENTSIKVTAELIIKPSKKK
jgi:hypothetical protein